MLKLKLMFLTILFILLCFGNITMISGNELQTSPQTSKILAEQQPKSSFKSDEKADQIKKTTNDPLIAAPINQSNELKKNPKNDGQKSTNEGTEFCIFSGYKFRITDLLLVGFTFALVVCTGILAWIAYWQYIAMILSQRAFIFLKRIDFEPVMILQGLEGYQEGQKWLLSPCWENSGTTPTKNLTISINSKVFDSEIPHDWDFPYSKIKDIPMVIGPKAEIIVGAFAIPYINIIEPLQGSQITNLYIWGEAKYNDIFSDKIHCTRFCIKMLFLKQQIVGEYDVPTFIYYDRYNYAD